MKIANWNSKVPWTTFFRNCSRDKDWQIVRLCHGSRLASDCPASVRLEERNEIVIRQGWHSREPPVGDTLVLDLNLAKKDLPESLLTLSALVADLNPEFLNTGCPNSSVRNSSTVIEGCSWIRECSKSWRLKLVSWDHTDHSSFYSFGPILLGAMSKISFSKGSPFVIWERSLSRDRLELLCRVHLRSLRCGEACSPVSYSIADLKRSISLKFF